MASKQWGEMTAKEKASGIIGLLLVVVILVVVFTALGSGEDTNTSEGQQVVDQTLSEPDQIKQIVSNVLPGQNRSDQEYIRKVDVVEQANGGYGVFVEYNAENFKKILIDEEMADIYIALYTSGKDVLAASVSAYSALMDEYGNEKEVVVYKTILDKTEADKVNFDADEAALQVSILPGVWNVATKHRDLE